MKTIEPDFSDENVSADLQRVVGRMVRAKWISGWALVTPARVTVQLTELGRRQVKRLSRALRPFEDRLICDGERKASGWDWLRLKFALAVHAFRLFWPWATTQEYFAMIVLLATEARRLRLSGGQ